MFRIMIFMFIFSSHLFSTQLPQFTLVKDVLKESEMIQFQQLTEEFQSELLWYGRYNFWRESFEGKMNDTDQTFIYTHYNEHVSNTITDKLATFFLEKIREFGVDIANKRIILQSYLDRNVVNIENAASSGMFWHRDVITVDGQLEIADFTMLLLINGKVQNWEGADVGLQFGGEYSDEGSYSWVNSDFPKVMLKASYNQAIVFKNSDAGHMVTPLIPLSDIPVQRDVFIINCYLQSITCP